MIISSDDNVSGMVIIREVISFFFKPKDNKTFKASCWFWFKLVDAFLFSLWILAKVDGFIFPFKSRMIWLAAFGPIEGSFFKELTSSFSTNVKNCSTETLDKAPNADLTPIPLTVNSWSKIDFSSKDKKPINCSSSSLTMWVK